MIERLAAEFEKHDIIIDGVKTGDFPTVKSFAVLSRKVNEIIDHINNQQPKKPKSTNIALRQRIADLEHALKHIISISGAGLSSQEKIADMKEVAKSGLDPEYSPILVGRYTYPISEN